MTPAEWIVGIVLLITISSFVAEAYDRLARKYGWPR